MKLFIGGLLVQNEHDSINIERAKEKMMHYYWQEDTLYFQNLVVPKPKGRSQIIKKMHNGIGHFGEARTFFESKQRFFWHDRIDFVNFFVKAYEKCQLAKQNHKLKSNVEGMKNILVCDLFDCVALDIVGLLPQTSIGNKYVLVVVDHYSKWCEACIVKEHDVTTIVKFL